MNKSIKYLYFFFIIGVVGCASFPENAPNLSTSLSLENKLKTLGEKGILYGHQDDLAYGVDWEYEKDRSDTYETAGDYPAIFGWELGGLELGHKTNLDTVPFNKMRNFAIKVHKGGGINTFSWHPFSVLDTTKSSWTNDVRVVKEIIPGGSHHQGFKDQLDKIASFFSSLQDKNGNQIPFIFRPWHEMDGNWFWWGTKTTTPQELQDLFRFTIEYLREEKGLDFLSAYSTDRNFNSEEEYLTWYPGDEYVDIIGMDNYHDFTKDGGGVSEASRKLEIVVDYANKKDKIAALTESGSAQVENSKWFTQKLGKAVLANSKTRQIAYVMLWRNAGRWHFFTAFKGSPAEGDFKEFTDNDAIWLLEDWNNFKKEN